MSPAPRWPVVLFDFDGTLLNTIDGFVASYIYTWQTVSGRQVVRSEILPWIGRTLADVFADEDPANAAELEDVYLSHNAATLANAVRQYDGISELAQELVDAVAFFKLSQGQGTVRTAAPPRSAPIARPAVPRPAPAARVVARKQAMPGLAAPAPAPKSVAKAAPSASAEDWESF